MSESNPQMRARTWPTTWRTSYHQRMATQPMSLEEIQAVLAEAQALTDEAEQLIAQSRNLQIVARALREEVRRARELEDQERMRRDSGEV